MATVLFLSAPAHGNVNPTLGLVAELVKQGEQVIYFTSETFKKAVEATGATYAPYVIDMDIFKPLVPGHPRPLPGVIAQAEHVVADILEYIKNIRIDYLIHSMGFPFASIIRQILKVPTISSLAVFAGLDQMEKRINSGENFMGSAEMDAAYEPVARSIEKRYGIQMPERPLQLLMNRGDLNIVYTSRYFAPESTFFDDSFIFVGPPIYDRGQQMDFPFDLLEGKDVIYISLGTVFSNFDKSIYQIFFDAFKNSPYLVVMAAHQVDLAEVPDNFIVRDYVPQRELLRFTKVAITHAGMNSMSDLIDQHVPFVSIPLGADQPLLAARANELGATVVLDHKQLTAEELREAVTEVTKSSYRENLVKIDQSFREAGGYPKAVDAIFKLVKGIN
ncbi:macrolide family glycosyltransferase [Mucilaginibacter sp. CAU 1740]|uniref:macrolide family glycosyltransferase n=1 Tax=Mucilaginibacter sp. CAU 1740 TaxID=3140365 RepID=UPI00325A880A